MANASRRGLLAGLASLTGVGAPIAAPALLPILPAVALTAPPADLALIEFGRVWAAAVATFCEAQAAYGTAERSFREALGHCPPELFADDFHRELNAVRRATGQRLHLPWDEALIDGEIAYLNRWSGSVLRTVIASLPSACGRAGRTPNDIRHLRSLLPASDARDAAEAHWRAVHDLDGRYAAVKAAREAENAAETPILDLPATSLAGVAVKARLASHVLQRWAEHSPGAQQTRYLTCIMDAALAAAEAQS